MNLYEKLWNEKKRELAEKIAKAPNANAAGREAAELAEMVMTEAIMSTDHLTIKQGKIPEEIERLIAGNNIRGIAIRIKKEPDAEASSKKFEELEAAAEPVIEFLNKYFDPHTAVIITEGKATVVRDEMSIPFPVRD